MAKKTGARRTSKRVKQEMDAKREEMLAQVKAGEYRVSELETLTLQKLKAQGEAAGEKFKAAQAEAVRLQGDARRAAARFQDGVNKVFKAHGFEEWFSVDLTEDRGGLVTEDAELKAQVEAQRAKKAKEKESKETKDAKDTEVPAPAAKAASGKGTHK